MQLHRKKKVSKYVSFYLSRKGLESHSAKSWKDFVPAGGRDT